MTLPLIRTHERLNRSIILHGPKRALLCRVYYWCISIFINFIAARLDHENFQLFRAMFYRPTLVGLWLLICHAKKSRNITLYIEFPRLNDWIGKKRLLYVLRSFLERKWEKKCQKLLIKIFALFYPSNIIYLSKSASWKVCLAKLKYAFVKYNFPSEKIRHFFI